MEIKKDKWLDTFNKAEAQAMKLGIRFNPRSQAEADMEADFNAAKAIMEEAQTIVFPSDTMIQLIQTLDRISTVGSLKLPYPYIFVQFTNPIPESKFMAHEERIVLEEYKVYRDDFVDGILIANTEDSTKHRDIRYMMNACVLFQSTCVNRVGWKDEGKSAEPDWLGYPKKNILQTAIDNKMRMIAISYALSLFFNAPNVYLEKTVPDPKVQRKRESKGKRKLPEFHTVVIRKTLYESQNPSDGKGTAHGHMYPVRGHFRRIQGYDEPLWIPNHFRGLQYGPESMRKEIYKVHPQDKDSDVG